jgi:GxxExxY protein
VEPGHGGAIPAMLAPAGDRHQRAPETRPRLLESVYNQCFCWALHQNGLSIEREVSLPLEFEGLRLDRGYQADIIVEQTVLLELKSVERILPIHEAQTRTYLKLSGCQIGLLMNFNSVMLKDALRRFIA